MITIPFIFLLQGLENFSQLIRAGCSALSTSNTLKTSDSFLDRHVLDQSAYTLSVAFAPSCIYDLLDDVVLDLDVDLL